MRAFVAATMGIGILLSQAGCYQYVPLADTAPLPEAGSEIKLQFSSPQAMELGSMTVHDVSEIEGEVFEIEGDTMAVFSRWLRSAFGPKYATDGAVFYVPRSHTSRLEQRRFIPVKTGLAVGVAVVATVAIFKAAQKLGGGSNPGENGGEEFRIVFPLPFGIRIGGH
ncbi:MAG: hypothetical protein O7I93_17160 [Gemmatimonadetes bacterium]|nr:hypothetical protein [Gemmatimonadota bacterium]